MTSTRCTATSSCCSMPASIRNPRSSVPPSTTRIQRGRWILSMRMPMTTGACTSAGPSARRTPLSPCRAGSPLRENGEILLLDSESPGELAHWLEICFNPRQCCHGENPRTGVRMEACWEDENTTLTLKAWAPSGEIIANLTQQETIYFVTLVLRNNNLCNKI